MTRDPIGEALFLDRGGFEPEPPSSPFVAMQRVVVRMLFDPGFVERVYADPDTALAGLELDAQLVSQLLENDRRLWNADRMRRSRALKILLDEFKVTTTLALAERKRVAFLDDFFSSPMFHDAVRDRGYTAMAFVAYLEDAVRSGKLASRHVAWALRLEAAMARSRRVLRDARRGRDAALRPRSPGAAGERLAALPGVAAVFVPQGLLAVVNHVEKYLFELAQVPAVALCDDPPRPEPLPALDESRPEGYLLEPAPGGKVDLSGVGDTFVRAIQACEQPATEAELVAALAPHGIGREDARDAAEQLLEGGVLRRLRVAADGAVSELGAAG